PRGGAGAGAGAGPGGLLRERRPGGGRPADAARRGPRQLAELLVPHHEPAPALTAPPSPDTSSSTRLHHGDTSASSAPATVPRAAPSGPVRRSAADAAGALRARRDPAD